MIHIDIETLAAELDKAAEYSEQPYYIGQIETQRPERIIALATVSIAEQLSDLNWKLQLIGEQLGVKMDE